MVSRNTDCVTCLFLFLFLFVKTSFCELIACIWIEFLTSLSFCSRVLFVGNGCVRAVKFWTMQWEHDEEEDEIQVYKTSRIPEEKRHYHGRSSSFTQHRPKELPVFEDSFAKRLGQRSKSTIRERNLERTNASLTTTIPRTCKYQAKSLLIRIPSGSSVRWIMKQRIRRSNSDASL